MTLLERYQRQVLGGMMVAEGIDPVAHAALGLTGESGEVADLIKKSQYAPDFVKPIDRDKLLNELGDAFWYLTYLAGKHGASLEDLAAINIGKLEARHLGKERYSLEELLG